MNDERAGRALAEAGLTPREREVFWLVADRLRNREIAERLYIAERTVESHVASILRKLGGSDRGDLIELGTDLRERLGSDQELPQVLSSFVGRAEEIGELAELIGTHRLLTVTGPAGVGKTRLAFQVGRSVGDMPTPILVDLATVPDADEVERSFATALGLVEDDRGLRASLRAALRDDRHWLVVDNCEHVRAGVASLLGDLLSATGGLHVLATSRARLGITGELVYDVAPLDLPPDSDDPAVVLEQPSARLFADRAATASPGFEVTPDNARDVSALCRRLDGLPLAIELAAARIRMFSPKELLSHLDQRFEILDSGSVEGMARHPTLEAALRWSYDLLDDDERLVFERCSVFPGEFDYDTAAVVVTYPPLEPESFTRAFPRLLDRSLLSRRHLRDQTTAYRMLETFRAFAGKQLERHEGVEEVRRRHATHHIEAAIARVRDLRGEDQAAALRWFERRWVDLRTAMRRTLVWGETEQAWTLLTSVGGSWDTLGIRGELFDWLEELLGRPLPDGELGIRARITAGFLFLYTDAERAVRIAAEAVELASPDDDKLCAGAELTLGFTLGYLGDSETATDHLRSALERFRRLGATWQEARTLQGLGHVAQDVETMVAHLGQAAQLFAHLGDEILRANCLTMMASRALEMGERADRIRAWLDEGHGIADRTANTHELMHAELHRARLVQRQGDHDTAASTFRELLPSLRRMGDRRCASRCLLGIGWAALERGDHEAARENLASGIASANQVNDPRELAEGLRLLSRLEHEAGRDPEAVRLLGAASRAEDVLSPARLNGLPRIDALREQLTSSVDAQEFQKLFDEGRQTPVGQLTDPLPQSDALGGDGVRRRTPSGRPGRRGTTRSR
ncbi:MAG: LuxR C-terminal-related transcriptional regulator [Nitriliruptorales bacterium]|nr:LuxR C-terminal-related transcriptional regulator [Nitriliruptorales bacterium]